MAVPLSRGHITKGQPCNISSHVSCSENSSDHLNSHLDLKHPKTYCGFMSQPQALLHPMGGPIAGFLSRPRPRFWKKKCPKVSWRPYLRLWSKVMASHSARHTWNQALGMEPSVGMGSPGAVQDGLLEIWLPHLLQLSLDSSVHTWHCLKLVLSSEKHGTRSERKRGTKSSPREAQQRDKVCLSTFLKVFVIGIALLVTHNWFIFF